MSSRWFWIPVLTGNTYLLATAAVWYRHGWRWALVWAVGGPLVMLACAFVVLVGYFFVGIHEPPCLECGAPTVVQLRGKRYQRELCEPCARRMAGLPPLVPYQRSEEWKL